MWRKRWPDLRGNLNPWGNMFKKFTFTYNSSCMGSIKFHWNVHVESSRLLIRDCESLALCHIHVCDLSPASQAALVAQLVGKEVVGSNPT